MARTFDALLQQQKPEIVAAAREQADAMLFDIRLAEVRERNNKTQVEIAEVLGVKQPTVAGMEKLGRDLKLSSLKRYIEATGSKLRLEIELADGNRCGFAV